MISATYTEAMILEMARELRPGSTPVAADHDNMAAFADGEVWYVWFDSEDSEPEQLVLEPLEIEIP